MIAGKIDSILSDFFFEELLKLFQKKGEIC
jgi:hypothetical protein